MFGKHHRAVIIGGGFSGLGVAIRLLEEGVRDLVILEKAEQLGGTWRDNTYPGCACDVPSQLYSYSFAPNPDWSRVFAEQAEIQRYLLGVAERYALAPFVRTSCEVREARWDEARQRWEVETSRGGLTGDVLVAGTGPLHQPKIPTLPGLDGFEGVCFHSACWNHEHDLGGRRVAVIGTGSSAIQFVPEIQPQVERLVLFQRTAPWVLPKPDHGYARVQRAAFRYLPPFRRAYRGSIYGALELLQRAERSPRAMRQLQRIGLRHLRRQVRDPELRRLLTPRFVLGCKRLLLSNTYYPALQQPNVTIVPLGAERVTPRGVVDAEGVEHEVDTLVFATGFHVSDASIGERVYGRSGRSLAQEWGRSPRAYLGTCVHGFPNLFFMIGPNLGNGHSSAFIQIEAQAGYIASALAHMERAGVTSVEVKRGVQEAYNERVQEGLRGTVWNAGGCASWYFDESGRNFSIYPWSTLHLRRRLKRFDAEHYVTRTAGEHRRRAPTPIPLEGAVVAITGAAHGIGLATARAFVERGACVCLGDLDLPMARAAAARLGPRAQAFALDVTSTSSFQAFLSSVEAEVGPIDVLVNNAGVMPTGRFLEERDEAGAAVMEVNYGGTARGMKLTLPGMIERGSGHVVNVISMAGKLHVPGLASYVASKHAAVGLTAAVRDELQGTGVTVSAVLPGVVRTRLSDGISHEGLFPLEPEDVARVVVDTCRTRAAEVPVPRWMGMYTPLNAVLPEAVLRRVRGLLGHRRVFEAGVDEARRAYEAAAIAQGVRA